MRRRLPKWVWILIGALGAPLLLLVSAFLFAHAATLPFLPSGAIRLALLACFACLGGAGALYSMRLTDQARRDALTGLYSRYVWEPAITHFLSTDRRPLSLMLIDIDNFKGYNDRYGHLIGDQILQRIAGTMASLVRSTDLVGRYGGDEFIIILPEIEQTTAQQIAERLVRELTAAMEEWALRHDVTPVPTISIGVANSEAPAITSPAQLIDRADKALYQAKLVGNSVSFTP